MIILLGIGDDGDCVTIEIMIAGLDFLVNHMAYEVPEQDLSVSMVTMSSIPVAK